MAQTLPSVNSDEVLAGLDSDTRAWLQTLLASGKEGLQGNGLALRRLLKAGAPTLKRTKEVTDAIEARRGDLSTLSTTCACSAARPPPRTTSSQI